MIVSIMKCRSCDGDVGSDLVCWVCGLRQCLLCENEVRDGDCGSCGSSFWDDGELRGGSPFYGWL